MNVHSQLWTMADRRILNGARTLEGMAAVARATIMRRPSGLHFVSGPISTGGLGNPQENRRLLRSAIEQLHREGYPVWSQLPFEERLEWFDSEWRRDPVNTGYCQPILTVFYESVLSTGRFNTIHFLHGFESSTGALWEYENCDRWKIGRRCLSEAFSRGVLETMACLSTR